MTKLIRWLFEDRATGRIVVGQSPNLLMILFLYALGARLVLRSRDLDPALRAAQNGSLVLWSLDELLRGVNPFRRIGGGVLLLSTTMAFGPAPHRAGLRHREPFTEFPLSISCHRSPSRRGARRSGGKP